MTAASGPNMNGMSYLQQKFSLATATACPPVQIETGQLSGLTIPGTSGLRAFLGVPFAEPPIGKLCWRPPQRLRPWTGVRAANKYGPSSLQLPPPPESLYFGGETKFSEDCLYLNVYTGPPTENPGTGVHDRPVLVWFHFGAFWFGSGSNPIYDGTGLAARGVTVVTVSYRLGRFGFLAHPHLTAESSRNSSGNYGIMDEIAALQWMQRNIRVFGGDPDNITVGGISAGGASVHILRCSPLAKGLFHKATCESGSGVAPASDGPGHISTYTTLKAGEEAGCELLEAIGVLSIAELRRTPASTIMSAQLSRSQGPWTSDMWPGHTSLSISDTAFPVIDGYVLTESPLTTFVLGKATDVPMLAGHPGNEGAGLPYLSSVRDYEAYVKATYGVRADPILGQYPANTDSEAISASSQLLADQVFIYPMWTAATTSKSRVWYYEFQRAPPIPLDANVAENHNRSAGAFHTAGVAYAFGTLDKWHWDWTDADRRLSKRISDSWVQFVKTGDPNSKYGNSQDIWQMFEESGGDVRVWDVETQSEPIKPQLVKMAKFWDGVYGVSR